MPESFIAPMVEIDNLNNWQECLVFPRGAILEADTLKEVNFTDEDVREAFEYIKDIFIKRRTQMDGTSDDRTNKRFNSQASMVVFYLNNSLMQNGKSARYSTEAS